MLVQEDVDLMKSLNFDAYRFSISWSRIFPDGEGKVHEEGVQYYNNLIDYMIKQGAYSLTMLIFVSRLLEIKSRTGSH